MGLLVGCNVLRIILAPQVVAERLPTCVSPDTAHSLVFIGKGVLLLRNPDGEFRGRQLLPQRDTLQAAQVCWGLLVLACVTCLLLAMVHDPSIDPPIQPLQSLSC
jgi:hypothetical protein